MISRTIGARAARLLENGSLASPVSRALSGVWARAARITRPLALPERAHVIGVGGTTLGGSYKTPLALALATALGSGGGRVAVVAHAYRGWSGAARRITPRDHASVVGDDALWLARALEAHGVPVFSGARRAEAVALAARAAPLIVVDALLQARPERVALSLLGVDASLPWGAGACPPAGDLRASVSTLLAATDVVVAVRDAESREVFSDSFVRAAGKRVFMAESTLALLRAEDRSRVDFDSLRGMRLGLVLAVARPERVEQSLVRVGLVPAVTRLFGDHARPRAQRGTREAPVDVWLTTEKCATKLGSAYEGVALLVVEQRLALPSALVERALFRA